MNAAELVGQHDPFDTADALFEYIYRRGDVRIDGRLIHVRLNRIGARFLQTSNVIPTISGAALYGLIRQLYCECIKLTTRYYPIRVKVEYLTFRNGNFIVQSNEFQISNDELAQFVEFPEWLWGTITIRRQNLKKNKIDWRVEGF